MKEVKRYQVDFGSNLRAIIKVSDNKTEIEMLLMDGETLLCYHKLR